MTSSTDRDPEDEYADDEYADHDAEDREQPSTPEDIPDDEPEDDLPDDVHNPSRSRQMRRPSYTSRVTPVERPTGALPLSRMAP